MSSLHENYLAYGLSSGVSCMFENMNTGGQYMPRQATYGHNRFHPYTGNFINRQRNSYEAYYVSGHYLANYQNTPVSVKGGTLSSDMYNFKPATYQSNHHQYYDGNQQENNPWNFTPKSIQNLCEHNSEPRTSFLATSSSALSEPRTSFLATSSSALSSATGKDRSHPFYSRKRSEPAAGMTRTREKYRVVYSEKQRRGLEKEYNTNKFITTEIRAKISEELGLSARQIKIWFQNRRAKERRDSRKENCSEVTENSSAEEENANENSPSSQCVTKDYLSSCRFTGNENLFEERRFMSGQCRFSNQTEPSGIHENNTEQSKSCLFESRNQQSFWPSMSPSEWQMSTGNSLLSTVDVSPLTRNANFDINLRL